MDFVLPEIKRWDHSKANPADVHTPTVLTGSLRTNGCKPQNWAETVQNYLLNSEFSAQFRIEQRPFLSRES